MEMWLHELLVALNNKYHVQYRHLGEMPLELYQDFKQEISAKRDMIVRGSAQWISRPHPQTGYLITLAITKEMAEAAFQAGFQHVQNMVRKQLQRLAGIEKAWGGRDHIITIIVSGGSSLHPEFKKWIEALCMKLSLPVPLFAQAMEMYYG